MCSNDLCPSREKCYRFMAEPTSYIDNDGVRQYYQSYMEFNVPKRRVKCDSFWPLNRALSLLRKDMPDV